MGANRGCVVGAIGEAIGVKQIAATMLVGGHHLAVQHNIASIQNEKAVAADKEIINAQGELVGTVIMADSDIDLLPSISGKIDHVFVPSRIDHRPFLQRGECRRVVVYRG